MSNNVNALQKLKKIINPQQANFTGVIQSKPEPTKYLVLPKGQQDGVILCSSSVGYLVGTAVLVVGTVIQNEVPNTGELTFVEV